MLKAVFFDFDGTLADDEDSIRDALATACGVACSRWPELDAATLAVTYRQISETAWGDYDRFLRHLSSPQAMLAAVWNQALARWNLCDPAVEQEAADAYWQHRLRTCQPCSDTLPLLQRLAGRFHLSVLTNGAPVMQRAKLAATGLAPFFQEVFVGGEFTRGKPDPSIFCAALERAGCQPNQAVHIGDSLIHDIAGAHGVGIHSIWINRRGLSLPELDGDSAIPPNYTITSLAGLMECLEQIGTNLTTV